MPDRNVEAMVDGLTIMQAGELLLDVPSTTKIRSLGATTYIRSLEDLAFGLAYFDGLALAGSTGSMQWRGGESPGPALLTRFPGLVRVVTAESAYSPDDFLAMPSFRDLVAADLSVVDHAIKFAVPYFKEWISREASTYLGSDPILAEDDVAPERYLFGYISTADKPEYREYMTDRELQDVIPLKVIRQLARFIPEDARHGASQQAVNEFVSRNLLQLVTIFRWRESLQDRIPTTIATVPHSTRAAISQARIERELPGWLETTRALIRPALVMALNTKPQNRDQLIGRIVEIRDHAPIPRIRRAVGSLLLEPSPARQKILLKDMRRLLSIEEAPEQIVTAPARGATLTIGIPGGSNIQTPLSNLKPPHAYLEKLAFRKLTSIPTRGDYPNKLFELCPELGFAETA
jgi:hypothetical protein